MAKKYIFYDLETTGRGKKESPNAFGTTPKWEQIMQIAAIVTALPAWPFRGIG